MEKLKVKVGDAVIVNCPDETSNIVDYVVKVMPNGRFRLHGDQYSAGNSFWRANGTKNTKAHKFDKNRYVTLANQKRKEQIYRILTRQRLEQIAVEVESVDIDGKHSIKNLELLNAFMDFLQLTRNDYFVEIKSQSKGGDENANKAWK